MANPGTYAIDLADLKYALLATDAGNAGPTFATLKDLAAAAEMTLTFEQGDTRELRGDGGVVQSSTAKGSTKFTLRAGGIQPIALADMFGLYTWQQGSSPNLKRVLRSRDGASRPFFKLEGQSINNDQGDTHLVAYKCQVDGEAAEISLQDGEWGGLEITGTAYFTASTDGQTVTTSAAASGGATSISVNALTKYLAVGQQLVFGAVTATLTAEAVPGATTLAVSALSGAISSGATATYTGPTLKFDVVQNETAAAIV
jgi:hypothetical protein